jgi:hypothetical protein
LTAAALLNVLEGVSQLQQRSKSGQATGSTSRPKDLEPEVEDSNSQNHPENEWPTHESSKFTETEKESVHDEKEQSGTGTVGTVSKGTVDPAFDRFESFDIAHNDGEEDTEPIVIQPLTR